MSFKCKICGETFEDEKKLHMHLRSHKITLAEYYTQYHPRYNLLTEEPLPFKNKEHYFNKDFANRKQLLEWCESNDAATVKWYILEALRKRAELKGLTVGPCHFELQASELPTIELFQKHFGSYTQACEKVGLKPMFSSRLPDEFEDVVDPDIKIFIDTREQQPLEFPCSESLKLDFGDYAVGREHYDYTFVDRKSETDFKSTLSGKNYERFRKELQRTKDMDCYLFVVTETDVSTMESRNNWSPHTSNMKYIYHNMRVLSHEFAGNCQFIFTGGREQSQDIIPKILTLGKKLWNVDLQYYIDHKLI